MGGKGVGDGGREGGSECEREVGIHTSMASLRVYGLSFHTEFAHTTIAVLK